MICHDYIYLLLLRKILVADFLLHCLQVWLVQVLYQPPGGTSQFIHCYLTFIQIKQ